MSGHEEVITSEERTFPVTHVNVRTSIVFMLLKLLVLDIIATCIALAFIGVLSFPFLPSDLMQFISPFNFGFFLLIAGVKIILTLHVVLQWINEYYEITPTKIFYRRGILWRRDDAYNLSKVSTIGIQQGIFGRAFNYGTLFFYDSGVFKYYYLNYIHNPLRYLDVLHHLLPNADIEKEVIREHVRDAQLH